MRKVLCLVIIILILGAFSPISYAINNGQSNGIVLLLIESSILDPLNDNIDRWIEDVEGEGKYKVQMRIIRGDSPMRIKSMMRTISNLVGVLMIGDIPEVSFEIEWEENGEQQRDVFPTDLYYMDLNGNWEDEDKNSIFDKHTGDIIPEIWVGRLKSSNLEGNEIELLKSYFNRNHLYRIGAFTFPHRALLYVDDYKRADGAYIKFVKRFENDLKKVYGDIQVVTDDDTTIALDYIKRLQKGWSLVRLIAHGGGPQHQFLVEGKNDGKVTAFDIRITNPKAFFYLITSCGNFNYMENNYIGGSYVFSEYGLLAIGQAGSHDVLVTLPEVFFSELARADFGSAFHKWIFQNSKYGRIDSILNAVLIGDPTLKVKFNGKDSDGDRLSDKYETEIKSNPNNSDTDGDGLGDLKEVSIGISPLKKDTDNDNVDDKTEIKWGTNPLKGDTDEDGLKDNEDPHPLEKEDILKKRVSEEAKNCLAQAQNELQKQDYKIAKNWFIQARARYQELKEETKVKEIEDWIKKCDEEINKQLQSPSPTSLPPEQKKAFIPSLPLILTILLIYFEKGVKKKRVMQNQKKVVDR